MKPYYSSDMVTLHHGDCVEVLSADTLGYPHALGYAPPQIADGSIDAIVTDPPYGIGFMGHEWDQPGKVGSRRKGPAERPLAIGPIGVDHNTTTERSAAMHAGRYDLSHSANASFGVWCEAWSRECLRVLKPGGHILAFGGSRTWHRLAVAIEDAGFEMRDSIAWLYGSGFPKSLDVAKAIDKRPGVGRHAEFALHLAERRKATGLSRSDVSERVVGTRSGACWNWEHHQFPEAKWWPALRELLDLDEVVWGPVIAEADRQKIGSKAASRLAVAPGQGADRAAVELDVTIPATDVAQRWDGWGTALKPAFEPIVVGRKPLVGTVAENVIAHGTGALNIAACRTERVAGDRTEYGRDRELHHANTTVSLGKFDRVTAYTPDESGRWPTNVVLDESQEAAIGEQGRFFPTFRYQAKAPASERPRLADGTAHPTVKPLDLMRWCVRLVTPPGGTVLDLFNGSGTTAEACVMENFRYVGIEREEKYLRLTVDHRLAKPIQPDLFGEAVSAGV